MHEWYCRQQHESDQPNAPPRPRLRVELDTQHAPVGNAGHCEQGAGDQQVNEGGDEEAGLREDSLAAGEFELHSSKTAGWRERVRVPATKGRVHTLARVYTPPGAGPGDMADMSVEEALEKYGPSEVTREDILEIDDPNYQPRTIALVTGAASGIGRATAICLAANGLTVAGMDVDAEGLETVAARVEALKLPGRVEPVPGDLTDESDIEAAVAAAADLGDLRYLANIAGLQTIAPIADFPVEQYDLMHDVMQRAPLLLTKAAWPHLKEGGGVIGNMCSVHGHIVTKEKVAYNMVKFGLRGLTQSIAAEGGGDVRGFSVSTGYVKTELVAKQLPDSADSRGLTVEETGQQVMLGHTRVKEMMEPHEVGNLFVQGFSTHAKHLNGGDMTHDGGMSLTYE